MRRMRPIRRTPGFSPRVTSIRASLRAQRTQQNAQAYVAKLTDKTPINEDALKKALASVQ